VLDRAIGIEQLGSHARDRVVHLHRPDERFQPVVRDQFHIVVHEDYILGLAGFDGEIIHRRVIERMVVI
jgi:hypothetical protein